VRVIAIHPAATHSVDLAVPELPRLGDLLELDGTEMIVRSVVAAAPSTDVAAFVYLVPRDDGHE
jgi:hypothetical protein